MERSALLYFQSQYRQLKRGDDLNKKMNLIIEIGFDTSFSFIYSARPGTPAAELKDETPEQEKKHRLATLQSQIISRNIEMSMTLFKTT